MASELVHFPLPAPLSIAERLVPCRSLLAPDWNHVRYTQLARLFPTFHRTGSHSSASQWSCGELQMSELAEKITKNEIKPKQRYLIFEVCCADEEGEDVDTPYCRYQFR